MNEVFITLITTLGTITAGFFALVKLGLIQIGKVKNGNGIEARMKLLEDHFNHETSASLERIENTLRDGFKDISGKLEDIKEDIIIIRTKQNVS